jgi:flavin reductase
MLGGGATMEKEHKTSPEQAVDEVADVRATFLAAMANAPTCVSVVATNGPNGLVGRTVSTLASVSADPPSLLICVNQKSPLRERLAIRGRFSVSVLASDQADLADCFAGRPARGEPFDFRLGVWRLSPLGLPVLDGASATFECDLINEVLVGSHSVFIGGVYRAETSSRQPLVYHARSYAVPQVVAESPWRVQRPGCSYSESAVWDDLVTA